MYLVILDTSSSQSLLAVGKDEKIICSNISASQRHSTALLPTLIALLAEAGISQRELGWIAVGKGPGSYTGTRVGLAAAQALAFALEIPLISFCSPLAFLPIEEGPFAAIWPTKMGSHYLLRGKCLQRIYYYEDEGSVVAAEELSLQLAPESVLVSLDPEAVASSLPLLADRIKLAIPNLGALLPTLLKELATTDRSSLLVSPIYYA